MGSYFKRYPGFSLLLSCFLTANTICQSTIVKGRIIDSYSNAPVVGASIVIEDTEFSQTSDVEGRFSIAGEALPIGPQVLYIVHPEYHSQRIRIQIKRNESLDLDPLILTFDHAGIQSQIGVISLSEEELDKDEGTIFNISGLLQASRDVFLNAAAYDFSQTFFRPRGLDGAYGKLLINGIEMNKMQNGRPQWSNWGGLNDVQRNREFSAGIKANDFSFGDIAGTTNIIMRASKLRKGGGVSFATANKSYEDRFMAFYNSGPTLSGWSYSILASRRSGAQGFVEGTPYEANSFFVAVERKLSDRHSLNLTAFYTPNRRGKGTAITEEVKRLKGISYNPNWGWQDGRSRNSRVRRIEEPIVMLNHYWSISDKTDINTNLAYQFGRIGNSRLDYTGNRNPAGNYYQRLPSYFLRNANPSAYDFQLAYLAEQEFIQNGQLDWLSFYRANSKTTGGTSVYELLEDVNEDTSTSANVIFRSDVSHHFKLNGGVGLRMLTSENFAEVRDLLGSTGYLDIDYFGNDTLEGQSNLLTPERIALEGERIRYNYSINAMETMGFVQGGFEYSSFEFFLAMEVSQSSFQRTGHYQNGYFPEDNRSLGKSERVSFSGLAAKGGATYKITGRHFVEANMSFFSKPPLLNHVFANARQNNDLIENLSTSTVKMGDFSYIFRSPKFRSRLSAFYVGIDKATDIGFYFTQNAIGNDENNAFVQEIVSGISQQNTGIELGLEAQLLPTFKLKGAASFAQYLYTKDPYLYLAGDDFDDTATTNLEGNDLFNRGMRMVSITNYHVSSGPERAYQLGIEYRDPAYWWLGLTVNYFSNAYIDVSKLRRTSDFYTDVDGLPFNDYDPVISRVLLKQEQLPDYFLVNAVGGKSWRIKGYYIGLFASINNLLNQDYKTGGFEDSRRASYRQQLEEQNRPYGPIFGNRYFFGSGATYYINIYVRF